MKECQPYHQGQLDFFCGIYALINALRLSFGLGLADGRRILAETLGAVSKHPLLWQATLENDTDFYWLLRYLLGRYSREARYGFKVARLPLSARNLDLDFALPPQVDLSALGSQDLHAWPPLCSAPTRRECCWTMRELWPLLQNWLPAKSLFSGLGWDNANGRCLILRFHRHLYADQPPVISHWTTGHGFIRDTLLFFDCTANKNAVHSLALKECVLRESELAPGRLLRLEPDSIFFIERG